MSWFARNQVMARQSPHDLSIPSSHNSSLAPSSDKCNTSISSCSDIRPPPAPSRISSVTSA